MRYVSPRLRSNAQYAVENAADDGDESGCEADLRIITQHSALLMFKATCGFDTRFSILFQDLKSVKREKGPQLCNLHRAMYH